MSVKLRRHSNVQSFLCVRANRDWRWSTGFLSGHLLPIGSGAFNCLVVRKYRSFLSPISPVRSVSIQFIYTLKPEMSVISHSMNWTNLYLSAITIKLISTFSDVMVFILLVLSKLDISMASVVSCQPIRFSTKCRAQLCVCVLSVAHISYSNLIHYIRLRV